MKRKISSVLSLVMILLVLLNATIDISGIHLGGQKAFASTYTDSFSFNTGTNYYPYNKSPNVACGVSGSVSYTINEDTKNLLINSYTFNSLGSTTYRELYAYFYRDNTMAQCAGSKRIVNESNATSGSNISISYSDLTGPFSVVVFKCSASYGTNPNYNLFYNGTGNVISDLVLRTISLNNVPNINIVTPIFNNIYSLNNPNLVSMISISDADNDTLTSKIYIDSESQPRESKTISNTVTAQTVTFSKIDTNLLAEGTHTIKFEVADGKATINKTVDVKVDRSGPSIGNVSLSTEIDKITVIASASDSIAGLADNPYQYTIDHSNSDWMTAGQSNNISSNVINSAYDTSGNSGRKLVKLSNGWLVCAVKNGTTNIIFYKSSDNGSTWSQLCYATTGTDVCFTLASSGTLVYCLVAVLSGVSTNFIAFDATIATNINYMSGLGKPDSSQTGFHSVGLTVDSTSVVHAVWASKNSTYPNSFNIRYSKSLDGGATWATPTQITTNNSSGWDWITPCIVINSLGSPVIVYQVKAGTNYGIESYAYNGSSWGTAKVIQSAVSYTHSNPCAVVDGSGAIHVVWQGYDNTDTSKYNIRYSKSTDNGSTWSTPIKLTSGNSYNQINPSITCDSSDKLYVYWQGIDPTVNSSYNNIRRTVFNGSSWGAVETLTTNTTNNAQNPSLCANFNSFAQPLYIYQDQQTGAVKFTGQISFPAEPFEVSGLLPNTPHEVTFKAKDKAENISTWSQTVYTKAVQPTLTTLETSDTSMKLQVNDSNSSDTQYQIFCGERYVNQLGEITQDPAWIRISDKIITVTGLDNRVTYSFKIKARNGNGIECDASDSITGTTGTTKPAIPENITTQPKSDSITIAWDEVLGAVSYDVEANGIVHTVTDNLYYTHEGLNSQTTHVYRVRARNGEGQAGDWSEEIIAETLKALPPAVTGLAATKTSTTVKLNWNEIIGGGVVYQVQADGKIIDTGFENSYLDENLTVNSRHTYRVRAVNSAGAGLWSNAVSITTQFAPPTTPTNISGVGSRTKIVITWDKIPDATNYFIEAKCNDPNAIPSIIDNKSNTYRVIYGDPSSTYYLRIKAKNPAGESEWSETSTVRTYALETPEFSDFLESQNEVTLNWTAVPDAASYNIERNGQQVGTSETLTYTDIDLVAETTYSYRILAVSAEGKESNWSYVAEAITLPEKPPVPADFYASGANGMVSLSWAPVAGAIAYDLEIDGVLIENGNAIFYLYKDIAPKTEHLYRVRARNSGIEGDWHPGIHLTTLPDTIQPPSNINVATTNTVTTVKWEKVPDAVRYEVEVDGLVVYNGTRNDYVHRRLDPNIEHIYRIKSIGYVDSSEWSDRIINNAVTLICDKGKNAQIGLTASEVTDFSGYTLTVTYNPDVLQVDDLCTLTSEKELTVGKIKGTDVEIIRFEPGKIAFKVDKPIELGMSWSGIINRIGFKSKVTGGTTITYTVFIK